MLRRAVFACLVVVLNVTDATALTQQDRATINTQLDQLVKKEIGDDQSASEFREARSIVERVYSHPPAKDAFAFFTIEGFGGGNNYSYFLAVFTPEKNGYRIVGSSRVGGKAKQIDFSYVKVEGNRFYLRSGEFHDLLIADEYGTTKIYYRWWLDGHRLRSDGRVYKRANGRWVTAGARDTR